MEVVAVDLDDQLLLRQQSRFVLPAARVPWADEVDAGVRRLQATVAQPVLDRALGQSCGEDLFAQSEPLVEARDTCDLERGPARNGFKRPDLAGDRKVGRSGLYGGRLRNLDVRGR